MAHFKYSEPIVKSSQVLNAIHDEILALKEYPHNATAGETPIPSTWEVVKSEKDTASSNIKRLVLKGVSSITNAEGTPVTKEFFVEFVHQLYETRTYPPSNVTADLIEHSTLAITVMEGYDEADDSAKLKGHPVLYQWADESHKPTDRNGEKPVYMYMNITNNRIALVCVADPAVNFKDYRKSFMYVGSTQPFKYNLDDVDGNILLTAGCEVKEAPMTEVATQGLFYFGEYTSQGNNTFQMLKTKSGIEYQKHYPAFITQAPPQGSAFVDGVLGDTGLVLENQGFQASKWTKKYHLSPIYMVHPYEGYRGQLIDCIAVTKHNILHLDELIIDVEGKSWEKEVYKYFDIDSKQNFMNLSANQQMGVAFLKEVRYPQ